MSKNLVVFAACLLIAGTAAAQRGVVEVTDAWARATPGKAENGAAYLTIASPTPDRLTGLATPAATAAELHMMTMEETVVGAVMRMRPLAGVDLAAGQKIAMKPGAMHIMLVGLKAPLRPGQSFPMTLYFEKAGPREVTVTVEKAGAMDRDSHDGPQMMVPMPAPAGR
jgi:copper(I)-binding protein